MKTPILFFTLSCVLCSAQMNQNANDNNNQCCSMAQSVLSLMEKISQLESRLENTEKEVVELRSLTQGAPKVAFSTSLHDSDSDSGNVGPFNTATALKYKKVFTNIGSCYNPSTGMFTAQVKGLYFFHFTMLNNRQTVPNSVLILRKNGEQVVSLWDVSGSDPDSASNAALLPLEVGDSVHVELPPNRLVYDDSAHYNTFTGFLLFTV
uniref:C1q domain-containing protein n=1 Tax=Neogobius melanostomus TaxID=47308 RepID=A0A8C6SR13_9GOBI